MKESQENRKDVADAKPVLPNDESSQSWINQIPSRIWFPAGFVGFFFIIGGWNQLSRTWQGLTGRPDGGGSLPVGLIVATSVLFICFSFALRAWLKEREERRESHEDRTHWKKELEEDLEDLRFP
jgi:hypothetical protein